MIAFGKETFYVTREEAEKALQVATSDYRNWDDLYYNFMTTLGIPPLMSNESEDRQKGVEL